MPINPYRGLESFGEADADFFFGREAEIDDLYQKVQEQPVVTLIGASGIGKSSKLTTLAGHTDYITHLAFSPDGQRIITASEDGTARLWHTQTGTHLITFGTQHSRVNYAAFSPDGKRVVTRSNDGTVRLYRVFPTTQALIDATEKAMPRKLTREQREEYFLQ